MTPTIKVPDRREHSRSSANQGEGEAVEVGRLGAVTVFRLHDIIAFGGSATGRNGSESGCPDFLEAGFVCAFTASAPNRNKTGNEEFFMMFCRQNIGSKLSGAPLWACVPTRVLP